MSTSSSANRTALRREVDARVGACTLAVNFLSNFF